MKDVMEFPMWAKSPNASLKIDWNCNFESLVLVFSKVKYIECIEYVPIFNYLYIEVPAKIHCVNRLAQIWLSHQSLGFLHRSEAHQITPDSKVLRALRLSRPLALLCPNLRHLNWGSIGYNDVLVLEHIYSLSSTTNMPFFPRNWEIGLGWNIINSIHPRHMSTHHTPLHVCLL